MSTNISRKANGTNQSKISVRLTVAAPTSVTEKPFVIKTKKPITIPMPTLETKKPIVRPTPIPEARKTKVRPTPKPATIKNVVKPTSDTKKTVVKPTSDAKTNVGRSLSDVRSPRMLSQRKAVLTSPETKTVGTSTSPIIPSSAKNGDENNMSLINDIHTALDRFSCPICYEIFPKEVTAIRCGHVYCTKCIENVLKTRRTCPICNEITYASDLRNLFF